MNKITQLCILAIGIAFPAIVLAQGGQLDTQDLIDAVSSGKVIAIAAAAIMLLVNILKQPWAGGYMAKIPKRWRILIPIVLGGVAGILSSVVGGMPWFQALIIGLFTGPTAVFAHEAVIEALFGKSKSRTTLPPQ